MDERKDFVDTVKCIDAVLCDMNRIIASRNGFREYKVTPTARKRLLAAVEELSAARDATCLELGKMEISGTYNPPRYRPFY